MNYKSTVMIVDDNEEYSNGLRDNLRDRYDVIQVFSGEDAVRVYRRNMPDLVLMDLVMPTMGGGEAAKKILEIDPDANIITISGQAEVDEATIGIKEHFTKKAISLPNLLISIENHIDKVSVNIMRARIYTLETSVATLSQRTVDLESMIEQQTMLIMRVAEKSTSVVKSFKGSLSSGKRGILAGGYISSILITVLSLLNYDSGILSWIVSNPLVILLIAITLGLTGFWVVPMLIKKKKKVTLQDRNKYWIELDTDFPEVRQSKERGKKGKDRLI